MAPEPREQPSGNWQGIAIHPSGKRHTQVFRLKGQARKWATDLEAEWRRRGYYDPKAGERPTSAWIDAWEKARRVDPVTADKEASHLRNHIRPRWDSWPIASVRRLDVGAWVKDMELAGTGAHTIVAVVGLFGTIMRDALDEGLITANPCEKVGLPTPPAKAPFFWTRAEADLILAEVPTGPWRVAVDLDLNVGLRLGELLGLRVGAVDWPRAQAHIVGAMTRHGWRQHPKSKRSARTVPIPGRVLDGLGELVLGRPDEAFVFPAARGAGAMSDVNFRNRIWAPAIALAGICPAHRPQAAGAPADPDGKLRAAAIADCPACTPVPHGVPHDMRHTAASWLVMDGVDLYRVQALLGHESFLTTQRYAHLAPSAHERIRDSWRRAGAEGPQHLSADSAQTIEGPGPEDRVPGL